MLESNFMKPKDESEWELKYLLKLIERIAPEVKQNVVKDKGAKSSNTEKSDKDAKNKKNKKEETKEKKETKSEGPVIMILTPATNRAIEIIK